MLEKNPELKLVSELDPSSLYFQKLCIPFICDPSKPPACLPSLQEWAGSWLEPSCGRGPSRMGEAGRTWSSGRWRGRGVTGSVPWGEDFGPEKERGQNGVHLSLSLHSVSPPGLGGGMSIPKPGEPTPAPLPPPPDVSPTPAQPSFLLSLPGYTQGNGLPPGEYMRVSVSGRGGSLWGGAAPLELSLFLLQAWKGARNLRSQASASAPYLCPVPSPRAPSRTPAPKSP